MFNVKRTKTLDHRGRWNISGATRRPSQLDREINLHYGKWVTDDFTPTIRCDYNIIIINEFIAGGKI